MKNFKNLNNIMKNFKNLNNVMVKFSHNYQNKNMKSNSKLVFLK